LNRPKNLKKIRENTGEVERDRYRLKTAIERSEREIMRLNEEHQNIGMMARKERGEK
jgi:hypothetical protein